MERRYFSSEWISRRIMYTGTKHLRNIPCSLLRYRDTMTVNDGAFAEGWPTIFHSLFYLGTADPNKSCWLCCHNIQANMSVVKSFSPLTLSKGDIKNMEANLQYVGRGIQPVWSLMAQSTGHPTLRLGQSVSQIMAFHSRPFGKVDETKVMVADVVEVRATNRIAKTNRPSGSRSLQSWDAIYLFGSFYIYILNYEILS